MIVEIRIDDTLLLKREDFVSLVLARDGYKCQSCKRHLNELDDVVFIRAGKETKKRFLQAHHKDHDRTNNRLSNGISLCTTCHNKVHEEEKNKGLKQRNSEGQASRAGNRAWEVFRKLPEEEQKRVLSERSKKIWEARYRKYGPSGRKRKVVV